MCNSDCIGRRHFDKPGKIRIVVQGRINEAWSGRLAGMRITAGNPEDGAPTTVLTGYLRDQSQLSGVLSCLYDLHCRILLVEKLGKQQSS